MLTNLFYYNFYKPYLVHNSESSALTRPVPMSKRKKMTDKKNPETLGNQFIVLNKSLKAEVVDYANRVSGNVNNLKDSARYLVRDMEEYNKNAHKYGDEEAREWIEEDLQSFVENVNKAQSFMETQKHSASLKGFSSALSDILGYNEDRLGQFGIRAKEGGGLEFDTDFFKGMSRDNIDAAIGDTIQVINDIYEQSTQLMTMPLTEHMQFRGFNYHYNYKMGKIVTDSFNLIESGMIVDRVV